MNIPNLLVPNKKCAYDFKETSKKIQKRKPRSIRDLILEPEEVGEGYKSGNADTLGEEDFEFYFEHIDWRDLKDNICMWDDKNPDGIEVYILKYHTRDLLLKRLNEIYEECYAFDARLKSAKALIVDEYALILYSYNTRHEKELDVIGRIYKEKFGAKRLIKRTQFELK